MLFGGGDMYQGTDKPVEEEFEDLIDWVSWAIEQVDSHLYALHTDVEMEAVVPDADAHDVVMPDSIRL